MEIKYKLDKPYTDDERRDFIFYYGQNCRQELPTCYEIRETEEALEAWGYTDEEKAEQEREAIKQLTCTKRVFALMLQELGVDYLTQLKPLIESNPQCQLEWDLCIELLRENPLLDVMAGQLGITSEQLDALFLYANGELSADDFELYKPKKEDEAVEEENNIEEVLEKVEETESAEVEE